jgi:hypothetical protein
VRFFAKDSFTPGAADYIVATTLLLGYIKALSCREYQLVL